MIMQNYVTDIQNISNPDSRLTKKNLTMIIKSAKICH